MNYGLSKSAENVLSKSKINGIFSKKISFKNINLGDHFFINSIFEPPYFLKLCPIFEKLKFVDDFFYFFFL